MKNYKSNKENLLYLLEKGYKVRMAVPSYNTTTLYFNLDLDNFIKVIQYKPNENLEFTYTFDDDYIYINSVNII